ncbi:hypothetical protein DYH55_02820 [Methylovirgula sp. 4M-Z18]|nr:hypothetical protein DYH55_02820 [Methylovirgula sp. 4M-Z18]
MLLCASLSARAEMTFKVVTLGDPAKCGAKCPQAVAATGDITVGTAESFVAFLHEQKFGNLRNVILLHSPGGNVYGAMEFGLVLRKLKIGVIVAKAESVDSADSGETYMLPGRCMSACVYAFMGGVKRLVPDPSAVGIHRMSRPQYGRNPEGRGAVPLRNFASDDMVNGLRAYSASMGVSPDLITTAEQYAPDSIHVLSHAEMMKWHLVTPNSK